MPIVLLPFEQRIIDRAINEWQNDCGAVSMPKDSIRTHVVSFDTAKHIPIETLIKIKIDCSHGVPSAAWSGSAIPGSAGSCC